ncbi:hypothetical protein TBR22_A17280 [Luteitalea sp. TBR-22]|uniref:lactonase family protein n=1 Tax=Luteitalea sp. TBR-22 TaxID=2802971 RepID=UPI001AF4A2E9|nr:lactonase family protein [Luteitalea sp. TBR-22]BCS32513.1 hypothetical protein TBR22_A17280 [Luteitalea sp. TBR-22]
MGAPCSLTTSTLTRRSFARRALGLAVFSAGARSLAAQGTQAQTPLFAYVGTYSGSPGAGQANGRGIHVFRVDRASGALTPMGVTDHDTSPSALVFDASGTRLYSTDASASVEGGSSGTVSAFAVDPATGRLTRLNTVPSGGLGPTYARLHPSGRHLLVANYGGGSVAVLPVLPDGRLGPATDVKKTTGPLGPKAAASAPPGSFAISGHDAPHAHQIVPDPTGRFVLAPDLGLDRIFVWAFDAATGTLSPAAEPSVAVPPGDGPRHLAFHPNGRWLYSIQEEGSTIVRFDYDGVVGKLTPRQTVPTLPAGYAGSNFTSGIAVSPDGRFLYGANRLHDSLAIFAIGDEGGLTWVSEEWTRGDYPRSFTIAPGGDFLYCCNQRADHVTTFRVDRQTGRLTFTGQYTPVGSPSALAFPGIVGS